MTPESRALLERNPVTVNLVQNARVAGAIVDINPQSSSYFQVDRLFVAEEKPVDPISLPRIRGQYERVFSSLQGIAPDSGHFEPYLDDDDAIHFAQIHYVNLLGVKLVHTVTSYVFDDPYLNAPDMYRIAQTPASDLKTIDSFVQRKTIVHLYPHLALARIAVNAVAQNFDKDPNSHNGRMRCLVDWILPRQIEQLARGGEPLPLTTSITSDESSSNSYQKLGELHRFTFKNPRLD